MGGPAPHHADKILAEGVLLGLFMVAACIGATVLEGPDAGLHEAVADPFLRRCLMGLAMGFVAVALIESPMGRRSGAHMNPAVTLTLCRLGRIDRGLAACYVLSQCLGAIAGVGLSRLVLGAGLAAPGVDWVVTVPGQGGVLGAFVGEVLISAILFGAVLAGAGTRFERHLSKVAGALLFLFIAFEAPFSGMSLNPARSLGSAVWSGNWTAFWVYVVAPIGAMVVVGQFSGGRRGRASTGGEARRPEARSGATLRTGGG